MTVAPKIIFPVVVAVCIGFYDSSFGWDKHRHHHADWNDNGHVYNNEINYNFPRGVKVFGGRDYTIRGKYNRLSDRLVNLGRRVQIKKNQTVQRYDQAVSSIIDDHVDEALNRIDGGLDIPVGRHAYLNPNYNSSYGAVTASGLPVTSSYIYRGPRRNASAMYVGGSFNYGVFHGVNHIDHGIGTSGLIGVSSYDTNLSAEFGFNYNRYGLGMYNTPVGYQPVSAYMNNIYHLDEYSGSINVKYQIINSVIRPSVGLVTAYRYRTYTPNTYYYDNFISIDGIDYGFSAGLDFVVSDKVAFGADFKYMRNLTYAVDGFLPDDTYGRAYFGLDTTEHLNYFLVSFSTKLFF